MPPREVRCCARERDTVLDTVLYECGGCAVYVVAVPFILYLVRFGSSKSCKYCTSTGTGLLYRYEYSTVLVLAQFVP